MHIGLIGLIWYLFVNVLNYIKIFNNPTKDEGKQLSHSAYDILLKLPLGTFVQNIDEICFKFIAFRKTACITKGLYSAINMTSFMLQLLQTDQIYPTVG